MTGVSERDYSRAIDLILDASVNPGSWLDLLKHLAVMTHCIAGGVTVESPSNGTGRPIVYFGFDQSHVEKTFDHYLPMNPLFRIASEMKTGFIVSNGDVVPERDFYRTEFYNGWARPQGICSPLTLVLDHGDKFYCPLTLVKPDGAGEATAEDRILLAKLSPHLTRAMHVYRQLETARTRFVAAEATLDHADVAVFLVGPEGKVAFFNQMAQNLLNDSRGVAIKSGHLLACDLRADRALQAAILEMVAGKKDAGAEFAIHIENRRPLLVSVARLTRNNQFLSPFGVFATCAVLVRDSDASRSANVEAFATRYNLTAAETRMLAALMTGMGRASAARHLSISVDTAKSQLGRIFEKTCTTRQTELIRFVHDHSPRSPGTHGTDGWEQ